MSQFVTVRDLNMPQVDAALKDVTQKLDATEGKAPRAAENDFFVGLFGAATGTSLLIEGGEALLALNRSSQPSVHGRDFLTGKHNRQSHFLGGAPKEHEQRPRAPIVRARHGAVDVMQAGAPSSGFLGGGKVGRHKTRAGAGFDSKFMPSTTPALTRDERNKLRHVQGELGRAQADPHMAAITHGLGNHHTVNSAFLRLSTGQQALVNNTRPAKLAKPTLH